MGVTQGSGPVTARLRTIGVALPALVVATALALASSLGLPGCSWLDPGESVTVLGDSITALGGPVMDEQLGPRYALEVDGQFGATVADRLPAARDLAAGAPDQVVLNLGTNDVVHGGDLTDSVRNLDAMVALFADARCVHVVTVNTNVTLDGESFPSRAEQLNRAIEALPAAHPNVDVVRWDQMQQAAVDAGGSPTALTTDGVHPTDEGQRLLVAAYGDALRKCPRKQQ